RGNRLLGGQFVGHNLLLWRGNPRKRRGLPDESSPGRAQRLLALGPILAIGRALGVRAGVAELVDALVLGTSIARCGGSSPFARTRLPRSARACRRRWISRDKVRSPKPCRLSRR